MHGTEGIMYKGDFIEYVDYDSEEDDDVENLPDQPKPR